MNTFQDAFISYGRTDSKAFALQLYERLTDKGLSVWFDFENIPLGVDFQNQIDDGIEKADNFLFVIAPHSVNSPYCLKEIQLALKRNKRIIPLLHVEQINHETWQQRNPQGTDDEWEAYQEEGLHSSFTNIHPEIGKSNWVYFREGIDDFEQAFEGLLELLKRHQGYVRQHTTLLAQALEWQGYQQQSSYLLTGNTCQQAKDWLQARFKEDQPPCHPTDLHCEYITESLKQADNAMTQVFLAYTHEDKNVMEKIRNSLRREGFTVWTNTSDIKTGEAFEKAIQRGVEQADNVLYLLSPDAIQSKYCQHEINYASAFNKRIIPVLVSPTPTEDIPDNLRQLQYIDLTDNLKDEDYTLDESQLIRILLHKANYYSQHKTLLVKALKWQQQQNNLSILLRGYSLHQAQDWWQSAKKHSQHPAISVQSDFIEASLEKAPLNSLDVFIAYTPTDTDLAYQLNDELQTQGKTTWFEQHVIPSDVDIQEAIRQGIEISDNILFLLSSEFSEQQELQVAVAHAVSLNKRIVTIQRKSLAQMTELHPALANADSLVVDDRDFGESFSQLIRLLDMDREHVHDHTKWLRRALDWQEKQKSTDLLLRGNEFAVAQAWLIEAQDQNKRPTATDLQKDYIAQSEAAIAAEAQQEKQRVLMLKSLLGVVSIALVFAIGASFIAYGESKKAQKANLLALGGKSEALFSSNQVFESLLESIGAAGKLKSKRFLRNDPGVNAKIATSLANALYWVKEKNELEGHRGGIRSVKFSPDGNFLITASNDNTLKLWEKNGRLRFTLDSHQGQVRDAAFSPDGQLIASASSDKTVKLWRQDGVVLRTLKGHNSIVYGLSFSPDSRIIATAGGDQTVKVWNTQTGDLISTLEGHLERVRAVEFSPDGKQIASTSSDRTIKIWHLDGTEVASFSGHTADIEALAWSPHGKWIVSASEDATIKLWSPDGQELATFEDHQAGVEDIAFSPNGQLIASAGDDSTVRLWRPDGTLVDTLKGHETTVTSVAFSPDGHTLASGSWDQNVKLWALSSPRANVLEAHNSLVHALEFSPNNRILASVSADLSIKLWTTKGQLRTTFEKAHADSILDVSFSPDGRTLATASRDRTVKLWHLKKGIRQRTITAHRSTVHSVSFSPNGKTLATGGGDHMVKLWNHQDGTLKETFAGHNNTVYAVAWHPESSLLASASADNTIRIWNQHGIAIPPLRSHQGSVYSVAWNPNGTLLASGSADHTVKLWDQHGVLQHTLQGHTDKVLNVRFSPNGNTLISSGADNTIKIWQLDGTAVATLKGHKDQVSGLNFQPNGNLLASADYDHSIIFWDWQLLSSPLLDNLLIEGCTWVKDHLNRQPKKLSDPNNNSSLQTLCQPQP
ncbi:MAG: TIR domain-containing protein [Cyanobacteria bacterium P01_D01_bin.156]